MTKKFLILFIGMLILPLQSLHAEHYNIGQINETYAQCQGYCEDMKDQALEGIGCNLSATRSTYRNCEREASNVRRSCISTCSATEDNTINNCNDSYRDAKKECREEKQEDTKECKEAKKSEKSMCKQNKIDEKEACKELSGSAKRDCKKQASQNKKDCKKQARETKKICKKEARTDKKDCKSNAKAEKESCIIAAESLGRTCRDVCNNQYNAKCTEELTAYNECQARADPIINQEKVCLEICDDDKSEALEGYDSRCSNNHAGEKGATVTFINNSGKTLYLYTPMADDPAISNGDTIVREVACNIGSITFDFKETAEDNSTNYYQRSIVSPQPCCEDPVQLQEVINPK